MRQTFDGHFSLDIAQYDPQHETITLPTNKVHFASVIKSIFVPELM